MGEFKKGGFHLASNSQALILPIITKGLFKIKPTNRWTIKPGIIEIYIKDPIKTQGKTVDELLQETRDVFLKTLKRKILREEYNLYPRAIKKIFN